MLVPEKKEKKKKAAVEIDETIKTPVLLRLKYITFVKATAPASWFFNGFLRTTGAAQHCSF